MNPTRGKHDTGQEGVSSARQVGIAITIPCHLDARLGLEELVDVGVAQLPVAAHARDILALTNALTKAGEPIGTPTHVIPSTGFRAPAAFQK